MASGITTDYNVSVAHLLCEATQDQWAFSRGFWPVTFWNDVGNPHNWDLYWTIEHANRLRYDPLYQRGRAKFWEHTTTTS